MNDSGLPLSYSKGDWMLCRALERVDLETRINKYRMMTADGFGSRDRTTHQQSD
jgi:hypothetical protein